MYAYILQSNTSISFLQQPVESMHLKSRTHKASVYVSTKTSVILNKCDRLQWVKEMLIMFINICSISHGRWYKECHTAMKMTILKHSTNTRL